MPVVIRPLQAEWEALRTELSPLVEAAQRQQQEELKKNLFEAQHGNNLWRSSVKQARAWVAAFQHRLSAAACGWEWPLDEDTLLTRLLALNLERSAAENMAPTPA